MSGIVDPAVRGNKSGNHLLIGINRDRSFEEMFSDLTRSDRVIMAAISTLNPDESIAVMGIVSSLE
jgi:hypothetical protein